MFTELLKIFMVAVSVLVMIIPEGFKIYYLGLPLAVTLTLAFSS